MTEVETLHPKRFQYAVETSEAKTMIDAKERLGRAMGTGRAGLRASVEDLIVAALVAAPFAATFGISLSWLTWWPNPVIWTAAAAAQAGATLWIAGRRLAGENDR